MTDDQNIGLIWAAGALVLVVSALFSRRIAMGEILRTTLTWIAIFAVFFVGFSYRHELRGVWDRVTGELTGASDQQIVGRTLRIRQSDDGHFWANAEVNGNSVRFLIDSGATITSMNRETAIATDVDIDEDGFPALIDTANGTVEARRANIAELNVGPITAVDLPVMVAPEFGDTNVIGMNFLSKMKSWGVEGREMVLEPPSEY